MKKALVAVGSATTLLAVQAHAAVPAAVTTAFTDITADVGTIGGLVLVAALAILGFVYMKRTVQK